MADDDQKQGSTSQERIAPSPKAADQAATEEVEKTKKIRKIWNRVRKSPTFYGSVLYGWVCLIGMLHARSYYKPFGVDIFDFAEPFDFLLIAISKADIALDIGLSTAVFGIGLAFVVWITIWVFSWIVRLIICMYDIKNWLVCGFESVSSYICFVIRALISLLYVAWVATTYIASVRAAWGIYTTLRRTVWTTYIASVRIAWKTYTAPFRDAWKTYATSFRAAWEDLKESRQRISTEFKELHSGNQEWRQETRKNFVASLRRFLYIPIAAAFIFATFFMPSYRGEQGARALVSDLKSKQVSQIPILSWIYDKTFGERGNQQEAPHVRVALRQDSVQPRTRLPDPDRTLFLGTTSSFHLFYECGDTLNSGTDSKGPNGPKASGAQHPQGASECEEGRPFIVPTANIASLEFDPKKKEVEPRVSLPDTTDACASGWKKMATIGTFPRGKHHCLEGQPGCPKDSKEGESENGNEPPSELVIPDELLRDLGSLFEAGTLQQLMLIGRVDITPLNDETRRRYGSNNGLAQARAKRVWDGLVEKWKLDEPEKLDEPKKKALLERTILLSAGPLHVGKDVEDTDRAKDRSVEVWACGGPKPE